MDEILSKEDKVHGSFMTEKEFQLAVFQYLADYPQGVVAGVSKLAKQCEGSTGLVWKYATGKVCPGKHVREWRLSWTK